MMIPVLAGPTASGKTSAAVELAQVYPLEIISADAMMVYRGMDIGTAKPTLAERKAVPHHLIDVVAPNTAFNVADYVRLAELAIEDVLERDKVPFIVGGTGFYIRALVQGLPTTPEVDEDVQAPLWERFEKEGLEPLHQELLVKSPADAKRAQRNPRRVIRALEILERTGKAPSEFSMTKPAYSYKQLSLLPSLDVLEPRIEARTEAMFEAGLVAEVEGLLAQYDSFATARQAIGYKEVMSYLAGELTLEESKAAITLVTRQYAKRQRTWFRKVKESTRLEALAADVLGELREWLEAV